MSKQLSSAILAGLIYNDDFRRKTIPQLKKEYFDGNYEHVFELFEQYYSKYSKVPTKEALQVEVENSERLSEDQFQGVNKITETLFSEKAEKATSSVSTDWLIEKTHEHCLNKSAYLGVMKVMSILDGSDKVHSRTAIPDILKESLNINFDPDIGHDYFKDAAERYEYYHRKEYKIPMPLEMFNKITKGGIPPKSLLLFVAPTGVGKTVMKTFCSSQFLMQGQDVLYITLEMAEERIAERIDAALFDCNLDHLNMLMKDKYEEKIEKLRGKTLGNLIIKEYPPGAISANNIRALLDELDATKGFRPKVLCVDYLNLLKSSRLKVGQDNSYAQIKAVTEELRAIAVEYELLLVTSTQTNRGGLGASSYDLSEISESVGTAFTADAIFALISTEEMEQLGQLRIRQLKNRFGPLNPKSFLIGMDRAKMSFYDLDNPDLETEAAPPDNPLASKPKNKKPDLNQFTI